MTKIRYDKGNFSIVPNIQQAFSLSEAGLKAYIAICQFADNSGGCWPSNATVAEFTGLSESGARKGLYEIRDKGFVEVIRRKRPNGSAASNHYQIIILDTTQLGVTARAGGVSQPGHPLTIPIEQQVPKGTCAARGASKEKDSAPNETKKLFYDVTKKYRLGITDHNNIRKWAKNLESTLGAQTAQLYLTRLLERDINDEALTGEYVPTVTTAFDVVNKSGKIILYFKRTKDQSTAVKQDADEYYARIEQERIELGGKP